jgi:hypothetical protein
MQGAVRIAAIATLVFLAGVAVAATDSGERASITVRLNPTRSGPEAAVWLGYPAARIGYIKDHESAYDWKPAVISPSSGGNVTAPSLYMRKQHPPPRPDLTIAPR